MRFPVPEGFRPYVVHARRYRSAAYSDIIGFEQTYFATDGPLDPADELLPKGGITYVDLVDEDGNMVASGIAVCRNDEAFVKKIGREAATGRACKEYYLNYVPIGTS